MSGKGNPFYDVLAILVVAIWGVTFVQTKVLINAGLTPPVIFFLRFLMAYAGILAISFFKGKPHLFGKSLHDELIFVLLGLTGGSLYFYTENTALVHTQATNVSFLASVVPILTCLMAALFALFRRRQIRLFTPVFIIGSAVALAGIFLVEFDGGRPQISPVGDMLAIGAALCWALYSNIMESLKGTYTSLFVTRKVFFYGLLTIIPMMGDVQSVNWAALLLPKVYLNLLFLSVVASLFCFVAWNCVLKAIGAVRPTNYLYLNPFFTMITAMILLDEKVTALSAIGSAAIVAGVAISQHKIKHK